MAGEVGRVDLRPGEVTSDQAAASAAEVAPPGASLALTQALEIDLLLEGLFRLTGEDFRGYERATVKAKLLGMMHDQSLSSISALQERALYDRDARDALMRALNTHQAALFHDAPRVAALRPLLAPWLRSCAMPKVWIAECTCSEDVFTLAILLEEEGLYDKTLIFATSANETLLQEARDGCFRLTRMAEYDENYRRSGGRKNLSDYGYEENDCFFFFPELRRNLIFAQYNLATDASFNEFQLIICRRPLAELGSLLRHRAVRLFHDSLSTFGFLDVDAVEELEVPPLAELYKRITPEHGLYRRIA